MTERRFRPGDRVLHRWNRDLGPGEILEADGRRLTVRFPRGGETLVFAADDPPFEPLVLPPGTDPERWHADFSDDLAERLLRGEADSLASVRNRLAAARLSEIREADGLGSYLGGRIELFPHQLHVAERATRRDPVRWLLADEVGLGKTIEACLILSHLVRTGRASRCLVIAPSTLTVQWLGELYRKFHQVFVLLDVERRRDVERELGRSFNPFEANPRAVISIEELVGEPALARRATAAPPDLLVVDEAHRLARREGLPSNAGYRAVEGLVRASRHVLLLSATPLEADAHGFYSLLHLLSPEHFASWSDFREGLERGETLPPFTSATRRVDIGGLPPRRPHPVDLSPSPQLTARETAALALPRDSGPAARARARALERAVNDPIDGDPRLEWLLGRAPTWQRRAEKSLVFVRDREALAWLKQELEFRLHRRVAVFHEELSSAQRDLEVAEFARPEGPHLLVSTECGGEGRNFQFCRRLVLFDLPWSPALVEQRIGRLDRIRRTRPVEIVYFRPAGGFGAEIVRLYERLGLFERPLGGVETWLARVADGIRQAAGSDGRRIEIEPLLRELERALERSGSAVHAMLHAERFRPEMAAEILSRVPADLESRMEAVIVEACRQYGFEVVDRPGRGTWYLEFGPLAVIDPLPGVPAGSRWLGTFDRATAVADETLDFFASGHPLVEAVLQELADGRRGQVAFLAHGEGAWRSQGLMVAVSEGPRTRLHGFDASGAPRPEWARFFSEEPTRFRALPPAEWTAPAGWPELVRGVLRAARERGRPIAAIALRATE